MGAVSLRQAGENRLFAGKVGVNGSGRDAYLLRNLAVVGPVEPLGGKKLERRCFNAPLILFRPLFRNFGRLAI